MEKQERIETENLNQGFKIETNKTGRTRKNKNFRENYRAGKKE